MKLGSQVTPIRLSSRARLSCISHLLSMISYQDRPPIAVAVRSWWWGVALLGPATWTQTATEHRDGGPRPRGSYGPVLPGNLGGRCSRSAEVHL